MSQCGRFIGKDKADIFDHIDIEEPFPKAVDEILLFLKKHAMRGADFSEIRRKDIWSIPVNILLEVIVNALVHADYSRRGTPTRVAFFDDRIEIESRGLLLPGLTVEDMKQGVSQLRNPVIARVFRKLELVEQWGSGIPGIFRQAAAAKLPEPVIEELAGRVRFTVFLPEILPLSRQQARGSTTTGARSNSVEAPVEAPVEFSQTEKKILTSLADQPLSTKEILNMLGYTQKTGNYKQSIERLLSQDLVAYTIPEKPQSRLQKYRLTPKGQQASQSS